MCVDDLVCACVYLVCLLFSLSEARAQGGARLAGGGAGLGALLRACGYVCVYVCMCVCLRLYAYVCVLRVCVYLESACALTGGEAAGELREGL